MQEIVIIVIIACGDSPLPVVDMNEPKNPELFMAEPFDEWEISAFA